MPVTYVHLSGRDTDATILNLYGIDSGSGKNGFDSGSKRKKCPRCGKRNPQETNFCNECGERLNPSGKRTDNILETNSKREDELASKLGRRIVEKFPEIVEGIVRRKTEIRTSTRLSFPNISTQKVNKFKDLFPAIPIF